MTSLTMSRNGHQQRTFEDLQGLRAEGYVRDSTLDQRDGFGPDIQRHNIERFAQSYGLVLGTRWYTEFVSGRSAGKRREFQQFLEDARVDAYDVLLVDHTSRFGRNQEECIRFKGELQDLGKTVVFVSQGIISGSDRDFLAERINETLDEQYSRNLGRWVAAGYAEKARLGYANGKAPLGYQSVKHPNGKREHKAPDPETMPVLLEVLRLYASGQHSLQSAADALNAKGYRTSTASPFTITTIEAVLDNRFYEGKVVYHPGQPDETVIDGLHEVPAEVRVLWGQCQEIRATRRQGFLVGRPRSQQRAYPFAKVTSCARCGARYGAQWGLEKRAKEVRRLVHSRVGCGVRPLSVRIDALADQFAHGVLPYVKLDDGWKDAVLRAVTGEPKQAASDTEAKRIQRALDNLRKQHLWGHIHDDQYRAERQTLERQLRTLERPAQPVWLPDLDRGAALLEDLPALWPHPGVDDRQREELVRQLLERVTVEGTRLVAIEPRDQYKPLFAYAALTGVRNSTPKPIPENFRGGVARGVGPRGPPPSLLHA